MWKTNGRFRKDLKVSVSSHRRKEIKTEMRHNRLYLFIMCYKRILVTSLSSLRVGGKEMGLKFQKEGFNLVLGLLQLHQNLSA